MAKKRRVLVKKVYDPIFMRNYWVSYGVPKKDFLKKLNSLLDKRDKRDEDELGDGYCIKLTMDAGVIIWVWTEKKKISDLAHEVRHAVDQTLKDKGVDDFETAAYTTGWLFKEILGK